MWPRSTCWSRARGRRLRSPVRPARRRCGLSWTGPTRSARPPRTTTRWPCAVRGSSLKVVSGSQAITAERRYSETMSDLAPPPKTRDAPIGGQAVLEGVMMRGVSTWAVAVRKPSPEQTSDGHKLEPTEAALGEVEVVSEPLVSIVKRHRLLRLPLVRGVAALGESLAIGFKALGISANPQLARTDEEGESTDEIGKGTWAGTVAVSIILAVGLFFLLPAGLTK